MTTAAKATNYSIRLYDTYEYSPKECPNTSEVRESEAVYISDLALVELELLRANEEKICGYEDLLCLQYL